MLAATPEWVALGIDPAELEATVLRYNEDARTGVDQAFRKGSDAYGKYLGDADHVPSRLVRAEVAND